MQNAQRRTHHVHAASGVLATLKCAHEAVLTEAARMQAVQDLPNPTPDQWAQARWRLSRASRVRRTAVEQAYPVALAEATSFERSRIAELQAQDSVLLAASRDHVAQWPPERIQADWPGYCAASRQIRASMTDRVRREQLVLLPILSRAAEL